MKMKLRKGVQALAVASIASLIFAGCSAKAPEDPAPDAPGPVEPAPEEATGTLVSSLPSGLIRADEGGDPVAGGTLRWGAYAEPRSLDPAATLVAASTGGIEMINIYDSLVRWDSIAGEFVPQTAKSFEANDTFDVWTITLNSGITFSDGTPYDAAAVKASQERYASIQTAPEGGLWRQNVASVEVTGDLELTYTLTKPWSTFPSILSTGPGMIVKADAGEGENFKAIGAGPFKLGTWTPQESISFEANENYWQGKPHLDGYTSVFLNDPQVGVDSLIAGDINAFFALQSVYVDEIVSEGFNGIVTAVAGGTITLINAAEGRPGSDVRVRKAAQLAVDPEVLVDRAFDGTINGSASLFPDTSQWAGSTRAPGHNPEEAKKLLEEAKADGFDGKVRYTDGSDPVSQNRALALQAQMEAVGFEVEIVPTRTIADRISAISSGDYDMAAWSLNLRESDPLPRMYSNMHSSGAQIYGGYTSPEMDALIESFQEAKNHAEQVAIMDKIQTKFNEDQPQLVWAEFKEIFAWGENVHGIQGGPNSLVLLNGAWLAN